MTAVFPTVAGLTWPIVKRPIGQTEVNTSVSLREVRTTYVQYPVYEFDLTFAWLDESDMEQLEGLFLSCLGSWGGFFFDAGSGDDEVTAQAFGVGDGVTTKFTLVRSRGTFTQPIDGSFGARVATVAGNVAAATFSDTDGTVTFAAAPANGAALAWSGNYYYRCRFKSDTTDFSQFVAELWENKQLSLRSYR
jgi:hypothetical protein